MRTKRTKSEGLIWMNKFTNFISVLSKEDKDKVIRAMSLKLELNTFLPQKYRKALKEYRELICQNQELFQRQKLMTQ